MKASLMLAGLALPLLLGLSGASSPARAYDNDEQALRLRDTLADPSVPLAWDHRHHPETWRYERRVRVYGLDRGCGRNAYWDGEECVRRRHHHHY